MNLNKIINYIKNKQDMTIIHNGNSLFINYYEENNKSNILIYLSGSNFKEIEIIFCLNTYPRVCQIIRKMKIKDFFDQKKMFELKDVIIKETIKKIHKLKMRKTTLNKVETLIDYADCIRYDYDKLNIKKVSKIKRNMLMHQLTTRIDLIDILEEENKKLLNYLLNKKIKLKKIDNNYAINNLEIVKEIYSKELKTEKEIIIFLEKINYKRIEYVISNLLVSIFFIEGDKLRKRAYDLNKKTILRNYISKRGSKSYLRSFILKELCICPKNIKEIINEETEKEKIGYIIEVLRYLFENKYNNDNDRKEDNFNNQLIGNDYKFYLENIDIKEFILSLEEENPKLKEIEDFIYLFDYTRLEKQLQCF